MWTDELIARLKSYVDASRWYVVSWRGQRVYGVEPRRPEYKAAGWAGIYLSKFDDAPPDPIELENIDPKEFLVEMLVTVPLLQWQNFAPTQPPDTGMLKAV